MLSRMLITLSSIWVKHRWKCLGNRAVSHLLSICAIKLSNPRMILPSLIRLQNWGVSQLVWANDTANYPLAWFSLVSCSLEKRVNPGLATWLVMLLLKWYGDWLPSFVETLRILNYQNYFEVKFLFPCTITACDFNFVPKIKYNFISLKNFEKKMSTRYRLSGGCT